MGLRPTWRCNAKEKRSALPDGWIYRCIEIRNDNTRQVTAHCLDPHDLAVSKLVAGREKDLEFLIEMVRNHLLDAATIIQRIGMLPPHETTTSDLLERWNRVVKKSGLPG